MWIIKIKILLVMSAIGIQAAINGIQNGYFYDPPESIPAELALYLNIPAGHDPNQYISNTEDHFNQHQQFSGGNAPSNGNGYTHFNHQQHLHGDVPQSLVENHGYSSNSNQHNSNELTNQYIPPTPDLPFIQKDNGFRPNNQPNQLLNLPFIQENTGLRLRNPGHQQQNPGNNQQFSHHQHQHFNGPQQHFQFQAEPRNLHQGSQNTINLHQEQTPFRFPQNSNSPIPSQELRPPPSLNTLGSSSVSVSQPTPSHSFMASVSKSLNVPLPFPFGVVPIKFDPLPLKTHLRQEKLLPISSYEAKVLRKK